MSKSLHVKYPLFLSDFNETSIFSIDFRKSSNITFHQNPSKGSRVVLYGQTDMTKQTLAFRNFANAHKNIVEPERTQTIWRLRVAYWIRKNACTRASTRARSCIHTHPPTHPHTHTHTHTQHTHGHWHTHTCACSHPSASAHARAPAHTHIQEYVILTASHGNSSFVNAPQYYVSRTLPVLLNIQSQYEILLQAWMFLRVYHNQ